MAEWDIYVRGAALFMHSGMLMKRAFAQIPHCAFFFSEDLRILLGSPCGSGTDLGVLANIFLVPPSVVLRSPSGGHGVEVGGVVLIGR